MAQKTVNKTELVAAIAAETGQSQATVGGVLDAFFGALASNVAAGTKVSVPGWIAVEQTERKERKGRNPRTKEEITIPASKGVKISAGSKLKAAVK